MRNDLGLPGIQPRVRFGSWGVARKAGVLPGRLGLLPGKAGCVARKAGCVARKDWFVARKGGLAGPIVDNGSINFIGS